MCREELSKCQTYEPLAANASEGPRNPRACVFRKGLSAIAAAQQQGDLSGSKSPEVLRAGQQCGLRRSRRAGPTFPVAR